MLCAPALYVDIEKRFCTLLPL